MLEDMHVLDLTRGYCGAFATSVLAAQGAQVYKILFEGDEDFLLDLGVKMEDSSSRFLAYNHNKTILKVNKDRFESELMPLVKKADVIVVNENCKELPLPYEKIAEVNPNVVFASIRNEGSSAVIQALSGVADMTGFPDQTPMLVGGSMLENLCGLSLAFGMATAYYSSIVNGIGEYIDFSLYNTVFSLLESPILFKELQAIDVTRCGNGDYGTLVPYDVYQCQDGYFSAGLAGETGWDRFCNAMEKPELIEDERFCTNERRCKNYQEATEIIAAFCLTKSRDELARIFTSYHIPNSPVLSVDEAMNHKQIQDRNMVVPLTDGWVTAGNPIKAI